MQVLLHNHEGTPSRSVSVEAGAIEVHRRLCECPLEELHPSAQVQLRDIAGFVDTRATILQLKPGTKSHWISFAIAQHLNGSHDVAAEALKKYEGLQVREHPTLTQIEHQV